VSSPEGEAAHVTPGSASDRARYIDSLSRSANALRLRWSMSMTVPNQAVIVECASRTGEAWLSTQRKVPSPVRTRNSSL
jgi:hypothetical protein